MKFLIASLTAFVMAAPLGAQTTPADTSNTTVASTPKTTTKTTTTHTSKKHHKPVKHHKKQKKVVRHTHNTHVKATIKTSTKS